MTTRSIPDILRNERGIALPVAMLALVLLMSLSLAFLVLGQTEPVIGNNHHRAAQARALAEAGLERAIWALTNSTDANGIAGSLVGIAPSPYNGSVFHTLNTGGFTLKVANTLGTPHLREVVSFGFSPAQTGPGRAVSAVSAQLISLPPLYKNAPCGLCVNGIMSLSGNMQADAGTSDARCGPKFGAFSSQTISISGSADVYGTDTGTKNEPGIDYREHGTFDFVLSKVPAGQSDVDTLRTVAKTMGTYIQPGSTSLLDLSGVPDGILFVDTTDGSNFVTASNKANVNIGPGWAANSPFRGWVVVLGDIDFDGNFGGIEGILYAQGHVTSTGMGASAVVGITIVENVLNVPTFTPGNSKFIFDCGASLGANQTPIGWFLKPGTYCDNADEIRLGDNCLTP
jgi:hypothetical protein